MFSNPSSNDTKRLGSKQAKQSEDQKPGLEEFKQYLWTENASVSTPLVSNASSTSNIIIKSEYEEPNVSSVNSMQLSSYLPAVKLEEEEIKIPAASPRVQPKKRAGPTKKRARQARKKEFQLHLPSRQTLNMKIREAIEKDGCDHYLHFQHMINEDSTLPSNTKAFRWAFALRFCSYFVLFDGIMPVSTLLHGNKQNNISTIIDLYPGLRAFLKSKKAQVPLVYLERRTLSKTAVSYFARKRKHQVDIIKFVYAFCAFLNTFLPRRNRLYKKKNRSAKVKTTVVEDETKIKMESLDEAEIDMKMDKVKVKLELDPDSVSMKSGLKAEDDD